MVGLVGIIEVLLMSNEINFQIKREIAIISEKKNGWSKQLNLISWNDGAPKYDIREWAPNHEKMGRGITLTAAETQTLLDALEGLDL